MVISPTHQPTTPCLRPDGDAELNSEAGLHTELSQDLKNLIDIIWTHANQVQADLSEAGSPLNMGLAVIQRACQRAWELTDAVKTRNLDGASFVTFDLNARIKGLLPLMHMAIPHYIDLDFQLSHHPLVIQALPDHLDRLVINLVLNARDAIATRGSIRLSLGTEDLEGHTSMACLRVEDTGHGRTPQMLDHLGRPFFTDASCGLTSELGLASLKALLGRMKGSLSVEHEPGRGSAFTIRFPLIP